MVQQEAFLNKLAKKLGRERRTGVTPPQWNTQPYAGMYESKTKEERIELFIQNLNALNTEVDRIDPKDMGAVLEKVIQKFNIKSSVLWDDKRLHDLQIPSTFDAMGIDHLVWNSSIPEDTLRETAARVDLGVTYADMGLAETGSVVLFNGGGKGRPVSLLPPVYLCILSEDSIVPRLTQAMETIQQQLPQGLPACINFITGPSRTGDIEMDLALGVHGPGKVHVVLVK